MKLLKGICKTLVVGTIIASTAISTFAQTETLTLQQAVNRAITSCDKKEVYGSYNEAYEELNKYNVDYFSSVYRKSKNNQKLNEYQMKHINEVLTYDTTDLYLKVVSLNKKIEMDKNIITIKEKLLKQVGIKKQKGMASALDYKEAETAVISAKADLVTDQKSLETAVLEFRNLTNMDILKYELEDDFTLEPVAIEGAISSYFEKSLEDYWSIQEDNISISELKRNELLDNSEVTPTVGDYKSQEATITEEKYNLKNSKEQALTKLTTYYNSLEGLVQTVKTTDEKFKLSENTLKAYEIKYKNGMISKLEYEQKLLEKQELENVKFDAIQKYILSKMMIENPTILTMQVG